MVCRDDQGEEGKPCPSQPKAPGLHDIFPTLHAVDPTKESKAEVIEETILTKVSFCGHEGRFAPVFLYDKQYIRRSDGSILWTISYADSPDYRR